MKRTSNHLRHLPAAHILDVVAKNGGAKLRRRIRNGRHKFLGKLRYSHKYTGYCLRVTDRLTGRRRHTYVWVYQPPGDQSGKLTIKWLDPVMHEIWSKLEPDERTKNKPAMTRLISKYMNLLTRELKKK